MYCSITLQPDERKTLLDYYRGCSTWFAWQLPVLVDSLDKLVWVFATTSSRSQGWHAAKRGAPR